MPRFLLLLAVLLPGPVFACPGDCDRDGTVRIDEVVLAVQIALDGSGPARCTAADRDGDGTIAIAELIGAVNAALDGCAGPTPTATPGAGCGNRTADPGEECDDGNRDAGDGCDPACQLEPGGDPCAGVARAPGAEPVAELVTDAVSLPVHIAAPRLDPRRVFVVEQAGRIRVIRDGALLDTPFLDIRDRVGCCGERGMLSVAFHPDYERNGRFFVDYTDAAGDTVIARFRASADPDVADRDSEQVLLTIDQPFANHNGGQIAFAPDGALFVGMGDGGSQNDPNGNGQDDAVVLGKLLRLDVDVEDPPYYRVPPDNPRAAEGAPLGLVWAKGLRNPWRFAFDRLTGDLYVADVGQDRREEVDWLPAGSAGGANFGWDVFEGDLCHEPPAGSAQCPAQTAPYTPPVLDYGRLDGCSVTGGFVYRGCALPDLHGAYFYSDYCTAFVRSFRLQDGRVTDLRDRTAAVAPAAPRAIAQVSSFGEDARGELYIADHGGEIYRVVPGAARR